MCEVCDDTGLYPVITRKGKELYCIVCPECRGVGADEPLDRDSAALSDEINKS